MEERPHKFVCSRCVNKTYSDYDKCMKCDTTGEIVPVARVSYKCYLNGQPYGIGNLAYMDELFRDYVVNNEMYDKKKCSFEIEKL